MFLHRVLLPLLSEVFRYHYCYAAMLFKKNHCFSKTCHTLEARLGKERSDSRWEGAVFVVPQTPPNMENNATKHDPKLPSWQN